MSLSPSQREKFTCWQERIDREQRERAAEFKQHRKPIKVKGPPGRLKRAWFRLVKLLGLGG